MKFWNFVKYFCNRVRSWHVSVSSKQINWQKNKYNLSGFREQNYRTKLILVYDGSVHCLKVTVGQSADVAMGNAMNAEH